MNEVSVLAAAAAGVVSFLSPCVLPLVPGYLSYVSGVSFSDGGSSGAAAATLDRAAVTGVVTNASAFVAGFTTIFVLLGASATTVGRFLLAQGPLFSKVAGAVIVLFGLHVAGVLRLPFLYREKRIETRVAPTTVLGSYGIGMAFAFGWTPCIGPILAAMLAMAATAETVGEGMGLLTVYSLGLGIPFLAAAVGVNYTLRFVGRFRPFYRAVTVGSGILLVAIGVLVFTGKMTWLSQQLGFLGGFVL